MKLLDKIQQIERLDELIRRKSTGSPQELANKLNISKRAVFRLMELMKNLDAQIYFCRERNSYCYKKDVKFEFGFIENKNNLVGGNFPQNLREIKYFQRLSFFCTKNV